MPRSLHAIAIYAATVHAAERGDYVHGNGADYWYYTPDGTLHHGNVIGEWVIDHVGVTRPRRKDVDVATSLRTHVKRVFGLTLP